MKDKVQYKTHSLSEREVMELIEWIESLSVEQIATLKLLFAEHIKRIQ